MSEETVPKNGPRRNRGNRVKVIVAVAGVAVVGVCVAAGINSAMAGRPTVHSTSAPIADLRASATPEQAYALSLPVLDTWLEKDFGNSWIVVSNTLEHVARALEGAAVNQEEYAIWVPRFERVISLADAVSGGDRASAKSAFDPLIAEEPGPYPNAAVDGTLSDDPFTDAKASLLKLDAAIAAEDRNAARQAVANTAASLSEVVLLTQVDLPADVAPKVLAQLLPAFHAIDAVQDAVLHGHAKDAAVGASRLHAALDTFQTWHFSVTS